jgi:hypothetical protein
LALWCRVCLDVKKELLQINATWVQNPPQFWPAYFSYKRKLLNHSYVTMWKVTHFKKYDCFIFRFIYTILGFHSSSMETTIFIIV